MSSLAAALRAEERYWKETMEPKYDKKEAKASATGADIMFGGLYDRDDDSGYGWTSEKSKWLLGDGDAVQKMNMDRTKMWLKVSEQKVSGKKQELVDRLEAAWTAEKKSYKQRQDAFEATLHVRTQDKKDASDVKRTYHFRAFMILGKEGRAKDFKFKHTEAFNDALAMMLAKTGRGRYNDGHLFSVSKLGRVWKSSAGFEETNALCEQPDLQEIGTVLDIIYDFGDDWKYVIELTDITFA